MKITVKGNIGADAVLRTVGEGDAAMSVCDFTIAEDKKKADGSEYTVWTKVTLWRKRAEGLAPYLKKGRYVMVTGDGEAETYVSGGNTVKARVHIKSVDRDGIEFFNLARKEEAEGTPPWGTTAEEVEEP